MGSRGLLYDKLVAEWVQLRCGGGPLPPGAVGIGYFERGAIVAGLMFYHHRKRDITMAMAVENEPMPLTLGFLPAFRQALRYPFEELDLPRISMEVEESNRRCLRLAMGYGAVIEGVKQGAAEDGGDVISLALYRGQGLGAAIDQRRQELHQRRAEGHMAAGSAGRLGNNGTLGLLYTG